MDSRKEMHRIKIVSVMQVLLGKKKIDFYSIDLESMEPSSIGLH